ncbi:MAG: hypothetical protein WD032_10800 [Nitrospirales bacterium]
MKSKCSGASGYRVRTSNFLYLRRLPLCELLVGYAPLYPYEMFGEL